MTQVFVRGDTKQAAAARAVPSQLKVDNARFAIVANEQVRLFGEVVVTYPRAMDSS